MPFFIFRSSDTFEKSAPQPVIIPGYVFGLYSVQTLIQKAISGYWGPLVLPREVMQITAGAVTFCRGALGA